MRTETFDGGDYFMLVPIADEDDKLLPTDSRFKVVVSNQEGIRQDDDHNVFLIDHCCTWRKSCKNCALFEKMYFLGNFSLRIFRFFIINKLIRFCISFKNASHQNDKTHRLIFDKLNLNVYIFNFFVKIAWRTSVLYCRNGRPSKPPSRNLKHYRRRCRRQWHCQRYRAKIVATRWHLPVQGRV